MQPGHAYKCMCEEIIVVFSKKLLSEIGDMPHIHSKIAGVLHIHSKTPGMPHIHSKIGGVPHIHSKIAGMSCIHSKKPGVSHIHSKIAGVSGRKIVWVSMDSNDSYQNWNLVLLGVSEKCPETGDYHTFCL